MTDRQKFVWLNCVAKQIHRMPNGGWEIQWTDKHKGPCLVQGRTLEEYVEKANER